MADFKTSVHVSGPFFQPSALLHTRHAVEDVEEDVADRGVQLVKEQLYHGHGVLTGEYRRGIHATEKTQHTEVTDRDPVVGAWLEGVSSLNTRTRFRGYAMFRRGTQRLNREAKRIAEQRVKGLVRRLNG